MGKLENKYQAELIGRIEDRFPGAQIFITDTSLYPGRPDILVLWGEFWAALEAKRSATASHRPNQDYYVEQMNDMSFSAFIYPENENEVLNAFKETCRRRRTSRNTKR